MPKTHHKCKTKMIVTDMKFEPYTKHKTRRLYRGRKRYSSCYYTFINLLECQKWKQNWDIAEVGPTTPCNIVLKQI